MPTIESLRTDLRHRLDEVRRLTLRVELTRGLLLHGAIATAVVLGFLLLEILHPWSRPVRTTAAVITMLAYLFAGIRMILRPALKLAGVFEAESDEDVARRTGDFFPAIRDRLLNALQLATLTPGPERYSQELLAESLRDVAGLTAAIDLTASVDSRPVPRAARWFAVSLLAAFLMVLAMPNSTAGALYRLIHFWRDFTPPARFLFDVSPGNRNLVRGEMIEIRIRLLPTGGGLDRAPSTISLYRRMEGQTSFDESTLASDSIRVFRLTLPTVRTTTEYYARADEEQSPRFILNVQDRPILRAFRLRVDAPPYAALSPRLQDEFAGDVAALASSRVTISGTASKSLRTAFAVFGDSSRVPLIVRGDRFTGSFPVRRDDSYVLAVTDEDSLTNPDPVRYEVKLVPDLPPSVEIVEPGRNLDAAGDAPLVLRIHAEDDFGFTALHLAYRMVHSRFEEAARNYTTVPVPLPYDAGTHADVSFSWDLSALRLVPEDVVEYFVEAFDNDAVNGPKRGQSALYQVRLPSLEEVLAETNEAQDRSVDELARSVEETKRLNEKLNAIDRDLKQNKPSDWQTQKQMEDVAKRYERLQQQVADVRERLERATRQMEEQHVLSGETLEKYLELQQMLSQIDSAELRQLLKQMQQGMPNVSPEQLRQAMQQASFSEERFRQSVERTLDLLKRLQVEQKLGAVKSRAEELSREQKRLREEAAKTEDAAGRRALTQRQEELAKREQTMEQESRDLGKRMEEFFNEMPADRMQQLNDRLGAQKVAEGMKQAARQMQQGSMTAAEQQQQQTAQQLDQFRQSLEEMQQQMLQQQSAAVVNAMRKATRDLLELSKRQEALKHETQAAAPNSPQLRAQAQDQQALSQGLQNVVTDLTSLSQRSFAVTPEMGRAIGEAVARMNNAMQRLGLRNGSAAGQEQGEAMAALNRAAQQVQNTLSKMMQGGGGGAGSLLQQLQSLAGQQMALNAQTRALNGSGQQAAEAARLAQQQEAVRRSLEQLNQEARASGDRDRILGDLSKITEEMKEVVHNLEQNRATDETVRQQERILSRMLDASTSMRERDFEKRRKAQTGTAVVRRSPAELDPNGLQGRGGLREGLLKALEQGYAKDYEQLIRKYFLELEKTGE